MSSKMVVRILSISMALLLLGMVVPSLSDADVTVAGEVDLGPVLINSTPGSETFTIKNEDTQESITLNFSLPGGTCGFEFTNLQYHTLGPLEEVNMTITWVPTKIGVCEDTLKVIYYGDDWFPYEVLVLLKGEGVPELGPSTVVIDGVDTGVENRLNDDKPISEHLAMCEDIAKNHGQYVKCVALKTRQMRRKKVLNGEERGAIMRAAAHANIPPIEAGLEGLVYEGKPVLEWIHECKENSKDKRQYMRRVKRLIRKMKRADAIPTRKQSHLAWRYAMYLKFHGSEHWEK